MRCRRHHLSLPPLLLGVALLVASLVAPSPVDAAVVHEQGFRATVAGWRSWYGSYGLGSIGSGWCIDHGLRAPDALYGYVATDVPDATPDAHAAMAWVLGAHPDPDRIGAAAMMLVLHDLMDARYPTGTLDVDRLTVRDLSGFEGFERAVLERAQAYKREALAHRHLRGPLRVTLVAPPAPVGTTTVVRVEVRDARGAAVEGARVHVTSPTSSPGQVPPARTGADGSVRALFTATEGDNSFTATVQVPSVDLTAWAPTGARAQRVAQTHVLALRAAGGFRAERPTGELTIVKTGDAQPSLSVAGAAFEVRDERGQVRGRLVVGDDGTTGAVRLPVGRYRVREVQRPQGYRLTGDQVVEVVAGARRTVTVHDLAERGHLRLVKVDPSGRPLAGAVVTIAHDPDGDGTFQATIATLTTGADGTASLSGLLPGSYQATEITAPEGHALLRAPVTFQVPIDGATVTVELVNEPRATARFRKVPAGAAPADATLAGATFVVLPQQAAGADQVRCTTGEDGMCELPAGLLVADTTYCWSEVVAPFGWAPAEPGCFVTGAAGSSVEVVVEEPSRFVDLTATKRDAVTGAGLPGATYDLYRLDASVLARTAPVDAQPGPDGTTWVGRATSGTDGSLRWPLVAPDGVHCIVEHEAPPGYERVEEPVCAAAVHLPEAPTHLEVVDRQLPTTTTVPETTTSTVAPTTAPPTTAPPTTAVPLTVPPTTAPPTTAVATTVPPTVVRRGESPPPPPATLPVTGSRSASMAAAGSALVALGAAIQLAARRRR